MRTMIMDVRMVVTLAVAMAMTMTTVTVVLVMHVDVVVVMRIVMQCPFGRSRLETYVLTPAMSRGRPDMAAASAVHIRPLHHDGFKSPRCHWPKIISARFVCRSGASEDLGLDICIPVRGAAPTNASRTSGV